MTDAERYRFILNSRIAQINFELDKIYSGAEFQLVNAVINSDITDYDLQKNPALKKRIEDIINKLSAVTTRIVIAGAESSWALSNKKNDDMVHKIFKGKKEIPAHYLTQTNPQNDKAFSAFIDRKTNGLNLSENVWKYNEGYKTQIENALQVGIGNGVSAKEMSKYLTQYLQNPTATIAEYDDKNISAQIPQSKKAQPGVYASPKKNAMRLARTEVNMAYDTADYNRWQQLDFVVGFEVHTSGNHTTKDNKGKIIKIVDICDKLAGKYPKDFKFTGWHPQCRCYMTSILKSDEEQDDEDLAILRGEEPEEKESENTVKDVPEGFKQWVSENKERLEKSDSLPYFVRDNKEYFSEVDFKSVVKDQFEESKPQEIVIQKTTKEITLENAKKRHDARTPEQISDIKKRWAEHEEAIKKGKHDEMIARVKERQQSRTPEEIKAIQDAWNERKYNNIAKIELTAEKHKTLSHLKDLKNDDSKIEYIKELLGDFYDKHSDYYAKNGWTKDIAVSRWTSGNLKTIMDVVNKIFGKSKANKEKDKIWDKYDKIKNIEIKSIRKEWRIEFNNVINRINNAKTDDEKFRMIAYADNIIEWSKIKNIKADEVCLKFPISLYNKFTDDFQKEQVTKFFRNQKDYIPHLDFNDKDVSYFSGGNERFVKIYTKDPRHSYDEGLANIIYHEYGHSDDWLRGLRQNKDVINAFDKLADKFKKFKFKDFKEWVNKYIIENKIKDHTIKSENLGNLTDIIQALQGSDTFVYMGHKKGYYKNKDKRIAEFIAHCSELNYQSNSVIFQYDEELFDELKKLCNKIYKYE